MNCEICGIELADILKAFVQMGGPKICGKCAGTIPPSEKQRLFSESAKEQKEKEVVGNCPICGAPIYGYKNGSVLRSGMPLAEYSCTCRFYKLK